MSSRERWIVYPILFMTLGIAMRDKVIPPTRLGNGGLQVQAGEIAATGRISCKQLQVDTIFCSRLEAGRTECRTLLVNGPNDQPVVIAGADANSHAGVVETFAANGLPQVRLLSTPTGGILSTIGRAGRAQILVGDLGQNLGVFGQLPGREPPFLLTRPWKIEVKPTVPQPPKQPAAPAAAPNKQSPQKTK
jgi:hypothetical protein